MFEETASIGFELEGKDFGSLVSETIMLLFMIWDFEVVFDKGFRESLYERNVLKYCRRGKKNDASYNGVVKLTHCGKLNCDIGSGGKYLSESISLFGGRSWVYELY